MYQTKSNSSQIKKISELNKRKIKIMNIGKYFLNKKMSKINYDLLSFNENSNSLRGIDV